MKRRYTTLPRYLAVLGSSILLFASLSWGADDQSDKEKIRKD